MRTFGSVNSFSPLTGSVTLNRGQTCEAWSSPSGWDFGSRSQAAAASATGSRVKPCCGRARHGWRLGGQGCDFLKALLGGGMAAPPKPHSWPLSSLSSYDVRGQGHSHMVL